MDKMALEGLHVTEMMAADVPFLLSLWRMAEVMEFADEFPHPRGWTRKDDVETAWAEYRHRRKRMGRNYAQLILRLEDGTPVGESFRFPLDERFSFGKWRKPSGARACMADIKLLPERWGMGLGTAFMGLVVENVFRGTRCQLFVVPPNRKNPAAIRVYERTGFTRAQGMGTHRNHFIMELPRTRFEELHQG
jgi:RimJ/RimL family protein N-acetyltransferase